MSDEMNENMIEDIPLEGIQASTMENSIERLLFELNSYKQLNSELLASLNALKSENIQLHERLNAQATNAPHKRPRGLNGNMASCSTSVNINNNDSNLNQQVNSNSSYETNNSSNSGTGSNANMSNSNNYNNTLNAVSANAVSANSVSANNGIAKNKKKILQTINANLNTVKEKIKKANCNNFTIKQSNIKAPIKISINLPEDVSNVREALKVAQISFHEFKWEEEKLKCFVIKGLVGATDVDLATIKAELVNAGLPETIRVSLFLTGYMRANPEKKHNSLIKLVLPPNCDVSILNNIKYIDHVAVKVEAFKAKSVVQCKNCQRFGHSAGGCMHSHRCVKCGQNHLRDSCERTRDKSVKLHCCNCQGEHTANNLTLCNYFKQHYNNNNNNNNNISSGKAIGGNSFITNNIIKSANSRSASVHIAQNAVNNNTLPPTSRKTGLSYSAVAGGLEPLNIIDLANKLDKILAMVSKHEQILANCFNNV